MRRLGVFVTQARGGLAKEFRQAVGGEVNLAERNAGVEGFRVIAYLSIDDVELAKALEHHAFTHRAVHR